MQGNITPNFPRLSQDTAMGQYWANGTALQASPVFI